MGLLCLKAVFFAVFLVSVASSKQIPDSNPDQSGDQCPPPENPAQGRLLEIVGECCLSPDCPTMVATICDKIIDLAEETARDCRAVPGQDQRACSTAATSYVVLEQIRRLLMEKTIYDPCPNVSCALGHVMRKCGQSESTAERPNPDDPAVQQVLGDLLTGIGKKLQTYQVVLDDIAELERAKHVNALTAMLVSFALPGLFGLCEMSHFRTGFLLQILALVLIGVYQLSRCGGYWALVGVGSCLLIMAVEFGILILIKKFTDSNRQGGKAD